MSSSKPSPWSASLLDEKDFLLLTHSYTSPITPSPWLRQGFRCQLWWSLVGPYVAGQLHHIPLFSGRSILSHFFICSPLWVHLCPLAFSGVPLCLPHATYSVGVVCCLQYINSQEASIPFYSVPESKPVAQSWSKTLLHN